MGFFDFIKKKIDDLLKEQPPIAKKAETNSLGEQLDKLTAEGELPFGWVYHKRESTAKIQTEYSYFLNMWLETQNKSPKEQYAALKSFILYLEDAGKLCKNKGECYEFWFYNYLTTNDYIAKRKAELEALTANLDELQTNFVKRNKELSNLDERIIKMLIEHPDVLQSDFVKMFDPLVQNDVREKLYFMDKSGKLKRTKSGKSYTLHYIG